MRKFFKCFTSCFFIICVSTTFGEGTKNASRCGSVTFTAYAKDKKYNLVNNISLLYPILKVAGLPLSTNTEDMNTTLQKHFLRKVGIERYQVVDGDDILKKKQFLSEFAKLKMTEEIVPSRKLYDVAVINGGYVNGMRARLVYLNRLAKNGLDCKYVVFLAGERPRNPDTEADKDLFPDAYRCNIDPLWQPPARTPRTEYEIAQLVWNQVALHPRLRKANVIFVNAPLKEGKNGQKVRPTTVDTMKDWVRKHPGLTKGAILNISSNPHVGYQHATIVSYFDQHGLLKNGTSIETVGSAAGAVEKIGVFKDALARWFYTEYKALQE